MKCEHVFKEGKALVNLATNGKTTDSTAWDRGEGIFTSKKVRTVVVDKCIHCGISQPKPTI
tara:strand:- start:341 stop:523 length:183 start_codon:yes stop_codon:yes gene_type:complete